MGLRNNIGGCVKVSIEHCLHPHLDGIANVEPSSSCALSLPSTSICASEAWPNNRSQKFQSYFATATRTYVFIIICMRCREQDDLPYTHATT
ncbi:hypothetical protein G7K_5648-t1 [Saitoella complicata NRRL Y-17804]|uniref:Uncharacterized protein n=1 Tax=Saitoella complicata (strain BCRC 22490 / CBS 7301 / JCM 7358 / NBRC 10748 / NRRL Y-17804) TaxID=698492 RepID=A0A0E9NNY6_SAICN|nr:hypothetical protein G7K_5648-t1 [Saitoella complicata NRRL Y-17804]